MRSRSNSGVRLDYYQRMVAKTILRHQVNCLGWGDHLCLGIREVVYGIPFTIGQRNYAVF